MNLKKKFTSRKFLAMIAGVLTGVAVIISGDTVAGLSAVVASVVTYLAAEGYIDAKAVNLNTEVNEEDDTNTIGF